MDPTPPSPARSKGRIVADRALILASLLLGSAPFVCAALTADDWILTAEDLARLDRHEVLIPASSERDRDKGDFRAAIEIDSTAERVFRTMTDCAQALQFVPHLKRCTVIDSAPDGSWQLIEHVVDSGWFRPSASYTFRAQYEPFARVRFSSVRGDFRENEGVWELTSRHDGAATVVTYRAHVVPRLYVPNWVVRASLRHDLPDLLKGLRARCEQP